MMLDEFQSECLRLMRVPVPGDDLTARVTYCGLALAGEGGEVANQVKKLLRDDGGTITRGRQATILVENSDALFYAALLAHELHTPLSGVAKLQLDKLQAVREGLRT